MSATGACTPPCYTGEPGRARDCDCGCGGAHHGAGRASTPAVDRSGRVTTASPPRRQRRGGRRQSTPEERQERRREDMQRLEQATLKLMESDGWQGWLETRARFRKYSMHNTMLILHQNPDATMVTGYRKWQELGYQVRRGEKAIKILAPRTYTRKREGDEQDAQGGRAARPSGPVSITEMAATAKGEQEEARGIYFASVSVFDRGQVEPIPDAEQKPLEAPLKCEPLTGESHAHLLDGLREHAREHDVQVRDAQPGELPNGAEGVYMPRDRQILLQGERAGNHQVAVLIHELAHAHKPADSKLSYAEEELVAESTAYTVSRSAGLDTLKGSVPYITSWGKDQEGLEKLRSLAGEVHRRAGLIEAALATT